MSFSQAIDGIIQAAQQMKDAEKADLAQAFEDAAKSLRGIESNLDDGAEEAGAADEAKAEDGAEESGAEATDGEKADGEKAEESERAETAKAAITVWPLDINSDD